MKLINSVLMINSMVTVALAFLVLDSLTFQAKGDRFTAADGFEMDQRIAALEAKMDAIDCHEIKTR